MKLPLVSVVMSVYNGQEYLNIAIDSILLQTYKNLEIIIVDDGSQDNSKHIIKAYRDKRLKYIYQKNRGQAAALNLGMANSRGKYVARMDADDVSYVDRLEKQVGFLEQNLDVALVGSSFDLIDSDSGIFGRSIHLDRDDDIKLEFLVRNPFGHGTVMVRRQVIDKLGGYDVSQPIEDYELWWRIAQKYKVANIPEQLYAWRNLPTGISVGGSAKRQEPITDLMRQIWSESKIPALSRASLGEGLDHYARLGSEYRDQYSHMVCALTIGLFKIGRTSIALNNLQKLLAVRGSLKSFHDFRKDPFSHNYNLGIINKIEAQKKIN